MKRIALPVAAALAAAPLFAQEQAAPAPLPERAYVYVKFKDPAGASVRYRLDCQGAACKVEARGNERQVSLSTDEKKELLGALQAEARRFGVASDPAAGDNPLKVTLRYDAPGKRLDLERRLPADKPADLSPEMLKVIATQLELDLSQPVLPAQAAATEGGTAPPAAKDDE